MPQLTRRDFLKHSMLVAAAATADITGPALAEDEKPSASPNERLGVAVIGARIRGLAHLKVYSSRPDTEVIIICDADSEIGQRRCDEIAKIQGRRPKYIQDLRHVFDDPSVDIVTIATPNHWHALAAIWAMQAGKDVYVEKPVSHNVSEGRRIVEAARKYKRICQTGTQSRSAKGIREAIDFLHSGKLGEVRLARALCYNPRKSIGPKGEYPIPPTVDYDLWAGPAPMNPVTRKQFHYDWHWFWDYGNGDIANQGVHQMDIARWGLSLDTLCSSVLSYGGRFGYEDAGETANTQVSILDYGPKTIVSEVRGLKSKDLKGTTVGNIFEGSQGYMVCTFTKGSSVFDLDGHLITSFSGDGDHDANFLKAVRSRNILDLSADILEGHLSSALCHLANISYRLGSQMSNADALSRLSSLNVADNVAATLDRTLAHLKDNEINIDDQSKFRVGPHLSFDPQLEQFINSSEADELLSRQYRESFVVPSSGNV